jgi:hypothetical protein
MRDEYKNWIARENETPPIAETIDSFKEYWADAIALVNQTAAPASQHGYGMAAMDDNASIASYSESLANFDAAYAATQESMKSQATTMAAMQGQLTNIQQFCMAVGQQPRPTSTPLYSSSTHSTIAATDATAVATATAVPTVATVVVVLVSHNKQPGLVVMVPARNNPCVLPLPTSIGKIGTTAILMVVTWMTPTRAHHAGIGA